MTVLYQKHVSKRSPPINLVNEDFHLFQHEFRKEIRETHVLEISNVFIIRDFIYKPWDFRGFINYTQVKKKSIGYFLKRLSVLLIGWKDLPEGLWITDNRSMNYFHWMTDALPRLMAAKQYGSELPVFLPKTYQKIHFVMDSLKSMNCEIIHISSSRAYRVSKLTLPSHTAKPGNYNHELIKIIRAKLSVNSIKEVNRKIYISRASAPKRKISNENGVNEILRSHAFEIHHFEDYSLAKQLEIMAETRYLVGLHGAGLTNMLFMPSDGKVLELRNEHDDHNNCYFSLASAMNHDYYYQLNGGDSIVTSAVNVEIDLEKLELNLRLMLNH